MNIFKYTLLLGLSFLSFDSAHAIFGSGTVPLKDYYEFGKRQTGVASVVVRDKPADNFKGDPLDDIEPHFGTANLIDVGIEQLNGRLLITAAHVIENRDVSNSYIRFMDENNTSQIGEVQKFFVPSDWRLNTQDIGFILLKEPVDIEKFKPLKLNLSKDNRSFHGKNVNVFGCTPVVGKTNSKVVIRESEGGLLRRGMTASIDEDDRDISKFDISFYSSKDLSDRMRIFRPSTTRQEDPSVQEKVENIRVQMKEYTTLIENEKSVPERSILFNKHNILCNELWALTVNSKKVLERKELDETIHYNAKDKAQLDQLNDTDDLDKPKLRAEWHKFVNDQRHGRKTLKIDAYTVDFYGPLPQLSGETYAGDSGGAWVIDDEIVGLSKFGVGSLSYDKRGGVREKFPERYKNLTKYFDECEEVLSQSDSVIGTGVSCTEATSIWDCREWIASTLEKITLSAEK